uniref:Uncharacterized protein n=1 Tax=Rhizophora mucronata TaxID=61149 RepID=A0A2P2PEB9_RHIMU
MKIWGEFCSPVLPPTRYHVIYSTPKLNDEER